MGDIGNPASGDGPVPEDGAFGGVDDSRVPGAGNSGDARVPDVPGVLGAGIDLVHVPAFDEDLSRPGSTFAASVFTVGERAAANRRGHVGAALARHLAGRWAAKEAVVKAWSQALYGGPPPIPRDELDWRDIEIIADAWGRVAVSFHGRVLESAPWPAGRFHVSISHDGDYATAVVVLAA